VKSKSEEVLDAYAIAYQKYYQETPTIEVSDNGWIVNGNKMNLHALKIATERMTDPVQQFNQKISRVSHDDTKELIQAIDTGNRGNLIIGKVLHRRIRNGQEVSHLETKLRTLGKKLPEKPTRSKFIKVYEAWVYNGGGDIDSTYTHPDFTNDAGDTIPMSLAGVSTYALYEARNLVKRDNLPEVLAYVYNHTIDEIRDFARNINDQLEPSEELRSLPRVPVSTLDRLKRLEDEVFEGFSRQEVLEFTFMFLTDLYDLKPSLIKKAMNQYLGLQEDNNGSE